MNFELAPDLLQQVGEAIWRLRVVGVKSLDLSGQRADTGKIAPVGRMIAALNKTDQMGGIPLIAARLLCEIPHCALTLVGVPPLAASLPCIFATKAIFSIDL